MVMSTRPRQVMRQNILDGHVPERVTAVETWLAGIMGGPWTNDANARHRRMEAIRSDGYRYLAQAFGPTMNVVGLLKYVMELALLPAIGIVRRGPSWVINVQGTVVNRHPPDAC